MFTVVAFLSLLGGLVNLYAPDVNTGRLFVGGWRDTGQVEDRIYEKVGTTLVERLRRPGWHVNDPSLVPAPDGSGWRMYYTGLSLTPVDLAHATDRPVLGLATSLDGVTWHDEGILLSRWNGLDLGSVWSAGALVVGNEVWLFTNSGSPIYRNYRIRLAADGRTVLGTDLLTLDRMVPARYYPFLSNLDVAKKVGGPGYWMVANTADGIFIQLYQSEDAIHWRWVQVLITGEGSKTQPWTPHLANVTADGFDLLFGWTERPGEWRSKSIHRWTWRH